MEAAVQGSFPNTGPTGRCFVRGELRSPGAMAHDPEQIEQLARTYTEAGVAVIPRAWPGTTSRTA
jgi:hypothetical protein